MERDSKFKVGDIVRFKDKDSENACYFEYGLENLEIESVNAYDYTVYESDKSYSWIVNEDELELQLIDIRYELGLQDNTQLIENPLETHEGCTYHDEKDRQENVSDVALGNSAAPVGTSSQKYMGKGLYVEKIKEFLKVEKHSFMWAVQNENEFEVFRKAKPEHFLRENKFGELCMVRQEGAYNSIGLTKEDTEATDWEIFEENTFGLCEVNEDGTWINIDRCGENVSIASHRYDDLEKAIKRAREINDD